MSNGNNTFKSLRQGIFFIALPLGILTFALPVYGMELGANAFQIGLFFTSFSLMAVLMRPWVGYIMDHWGRKPVFLIGSAGYALSMFIFGGVHDVWGIVLARALQGLASSTLWLSVQAITADVSEVAQRGRSFGRIDQTVNRAAILGTFLGFAVLFGDLELHLPGVSLALPEDSLERWKVMFLGFAVAGAIGLFWAWYRLPETRRPHRVHSLRAVHGSRNWLILLIVAFLTGGAWAMLSPVMMVDLQQRLGADMREIALAYLPAAIVWAVLPERLGIYADRIGRKSMMLAGLLVAAVGASLIPSINGLGLIAALWAVQAISFAAGDPAEQSLVADLTEGDQRGRAYGIYSTAVGLGAAIGPAVGGWLYESLGNQVPFYATSVLLLVCALVVGTLLRLPQPGRREELESYIA